MAPSMIPALVLAMGMVIEPLVHDTQFWHQQMKFAVPAIVDMDVELAQKSIAKLSLP